MFPVTTYHVNMLYNFDIFITTTYIKLRCVLKHKLNPYSELYVTPLLSHVSTMPLTCVCTSCALKAYQYCKGEGNMLT